MWSRCSSLSVSRARLEREAEPHGGYLDKLHSSHIEAWKEGIAELIAAGDYAPTTANSWLAILKVILKAARRELSLPYIATDGVTSFDTSEHDAYSDEEPNSLTPDEVPDYLAKFREWHPEHYAWSTPASSPACVRRHSGRSGDAVSKRTSIGRPDVSAFDARTPSGTR